jgi:REP element-mobilizing transposase RayT
MARRPRLQIEGASYHVMGRGNRRLPIFENEYDRRLFDDVVSDAVRRYKIRVFAACQMGNHYHFVLDAPRSNLSEAMGYINGTFAQESNRHYGRTGHLFEARFHSLVVQRERYFRRSCRYTVRNPVQAGLVNHAEDWLWSSYKVTAGLDDEPKWVDTSWLEWAFDAHSADEARRKYREYVNNPRIRTVKIDFRGFAIGTKAFKQWVARTLQDESDRPLPEPAPLPERPALITLFASTQFGRAARIEFIDAAHTAYGYSLTEIASFIGRDRSNVSRALRRFRARRAS